MNGDPAPATASFRANTRIYPLSEVENPPEQVFLNISGLDMNTIHPNDFSFYEEIHELVQEEPLDAMDPDFIKIRVDDNLGTSTKMAPEVYRAVIDRVEDTLIGEALKRTGNVRLQAAKLLGINRNTLFSKLSRSDKTSGEN